MGLQIFSAAASISGLTDWAFKGGLESDLAQMDLKAAALALKEAKSAKDPRFPLTTAITHLQSAEVKLQGVLDRGATDHYARPLSRAADIYDLYKTRILKAGVWAALGEEVNALRACDQADDCHGFADEPKNDLALVFAMVATLPLALGLAAKDSALDQRLRGDDQPPSYYDFGKTLRPRTQAVREAIRANAPKIEPPPLMLRANNPNPQNIQPAPHRVLRVAKSIGVFCGVVNRARNHQ